jgi:phage protein D
MADEVSLDQSRPKISIGGQDKPALTGGLLTLRIQEDVHGLYGCEAAFGNWGDVAGKSDFLYFDRKTLEFGKKLTVNLGTDAIFTGNITGLEAGFQEGNAPSLTVLAEDRFQELRMTRRTRTFADMSDSAVINQVATDHGLTPDVSVTGPTHKVIAQLNQSDLAFLRERARAVDGELWMTDSTLSVKARANRTSTPLKLTLGKELREFKVLADLAGQRTGIDVTGWDVAGKTGLKENAAESVVSGELKGGDGGASILSSAFGQRKETVANAAPLSSDEAKAHAEAIFKEHARRFVRGRGIAEAKATLRAGATVKLDGLGPLFEGEYYLVSVTHVFDGAKGLRTEFVAERPGLGKPK